MVLWRRRGGSLVDVNGIDYVRSWVNRSRRDLVSVGVGLDRSWHRHGRSLRDRHRVRHGDNRVMVCIPVVL